MDNPEAPSLVAVLIVNGNLPTPSSWSRRKTATQQVAETDPKNQPAPTIPPPAAAFLTSRPLNLAKVRLAAQPTKTMCLVGRLAALPLVRPESLKLRACREPRVAW